MSNSNSLIKSRFNEVVACWFPKAKLACTYQRKLGRCWAKADARKCTKINLCPNCFNSLLTARQFLDKKYILNVGIIIKIENFRVTKIYIYKFRENITKSIA